VARDGTEVDTLRVVRCFSDYRNGGLEFRAGSEGVRIASVVLPGVVTEVDPDALRALDRLDITFVRETAKLAPEDEAWSLRLPLDPERWFDRLCQIDNGDSGATAKGLMPDGADTSPPCR
jgi:hypothetical protein